MKGARGGLASVRPPMAGARWLALRQCWRGGGGGLRGGGWAGGLLGKSWCGR